MAGKRKARRRARLAFLLLLAALAAALSGGWWYAVHWAPAEAEYRVQGVWLGRADAGLRVAALPTLGARFAYVTASIGAEGRNDAAFSQMEAVQANDMKAGAVHLFDPCRPAEAQSANFVTLVPRDEALLPPAIVLDASGDDCQPAIRPAALEAELVTFLNQIEMHAGKRAILALSESFEAEYGFASRSERALWLSRNWLLPRYGGRPWELWTANGARRTSAADLPLRWVVARP